MAILAYFAGYNTSAPTVRKERVLRNADGLAIEINLTKAEVEKIDRACSRVGAVPKGVIERLGKRKSFSIS